jgi:hypothetical protein
LIIILLLTSLTAIPNPPSKKDSIPYPIRKIVFDYSFRTDSMAFDSSIAKLHILNPAYKDEHSAVSLIRLGYPIMPNNLVLRLKNNDIFLPANIFIPYIQDSKENFFYDTRRQFTSLTYKNEGAQSNNEEYLQVLHTQNLSKKTNIGFYYNLYSAYSKYSIQQASDHALDVFYRHSASNYRTYNLFYFNSFKTQENGGVDSVMKINYKAGTYDGLAVNLPVSTQAVSKFKRIGLNSLHEIKLAALFANNNDTTGLPEKDYGSVIYDLNLETNKRTYSDDITEPPLFYKHFYSGSKISNDSIIMNKVSNKILLNSPNLSKYLPNLRFSINNDLYFINKGDTMLHYNDQIKKDTFLLTENAKKTYSSTSATLDISQKFSQIWLNFIWDSHFLGNY